MKFFTKEVKIALTGIAAVILFFVGINFLKGINVFQASNTYYVKFKDINGLTISNAVMANGYPVGIVREIFYDYKNSECVLVRIELDDEMRVPQGTKAEIETELMGGAKMNLVLGEDPLHFLTPQDTIVGGKYEGSLSKMEAMIPTVVKILPKLDSIMDNLNRLTGDPALLNTLHNAADITADLKTTTTQLNRLLKNDVPQLTARLNRIGENVETLTGNLATVDVAATMQSVNTTLENTKKITEDLSMKMNSKDNTLGLMLNDRSLYDGLTSTVGHADSLMIDLKAHPKRYVHFSVFGKKDK
jgi:phospholipid/cholesterol/gamma-HCH transport system substrate-binding protein